MGIIQTLLKKKTFEVNSPITGTIFPITALEDGVFSEKMMGDGFFIRPLVENIINVYSPIDGKVESIFPTKHAISLSNEATSLLVHLGVDTVDLGGSPFELFIEEKEVIKKGQLLATMNINEILAKQKGTEVIVVFPEFKKQVFHLTQEKNIQANIKIGFLQ